MINEIITFILNSIHFIGSFLPFFIFIIPHRFFDWKFKYIYLIYLLIPMHWVFFDGCILSLITQKMGGLQGSKSDTEFTEKYMGWLYKPIINLLGWEWGRSGIIKMLFLHYILVIILLWYFIFFYAPRHNINI